MRRSYYTRKLTIYVDNRDTSEEAEEMVSGIQDGTISDEDLKEQLPQIFTELDEVRGLYCQAEHIDEWHRGIGAVLGIICLLEIARTALSSVRPWTNACPTTFGRSGKTLFSPTG